MTYKSVQIPGISQDIDRLLAIKEPYSFDMDSKEMVPWFIGKGFGDIAVVQPEELEDRLFQRKNAAGKPVVHRYCLLKDQ
jgi:hypothetical protein